MRIAYKTYKSLICKKTKLLFNLIKRYSIKPKTKNNKTNIAKNYRYIDK